MVTGSKADFDIRGPEDYQKYFHVEPTSGHIGSDRTQKTGPEEHLLAKQIMILNCDIKNDPEVPLLLKGDQDA